MNTLTRIAEHQMFRFVIGLCAAAMMIPSASLMAQVRHYRTTPKIGLSKLLSAFEQGKIRSDHVRAAFEADGLINESTMYRGNYDRYTPSERQQLLDGLERIAMQGGVGTGVDRSHTMEKALSTLASIATSEFRAGPEAVAVPQRLMRIYEQTNDENVKERAIISLGQVLDASPTASTQITNLLVSLIKQPVTSDWTVEGTRQYATRAISPDRALDALVRACESGVPTLRRLYAERATIPHDETRAQLEKIAEQGFDPDSFEVGGGLHWRPCLERLPGR